MINVVQHAGAIEFIVVIVNVHGVDECHVDTGIFNGFITAGDVVIDQAGNTGCLRQFQNNEF
ncbi:hypothetical protein D3C85_1758170 [compost metagenome]